MSFSLCKNGRGGSELIQRTYAVKRKVWGAVVRAHLLYSLIRGQLNVEREQVLITSMRRERL